MTFDETNVNRDKGGKFDTKTGSAPDIELPSLSAAREAALTEVFENDAKEFFPLTRKPGAKRVYKTSDHRTVSRPAVEWLMQNGYVRRATGPNLRGTPLAPTPAAQAARENALASLHASGQRKCSKCFKPSVLPADYKPLCSKHYLESIDEANKNAAERFHEHIEQVAEAKGVPNPLRERQPVKTPVNWPQVFEDAVKRREASEPPPLPATWASRAVPDTRID